MKIKDIKNPNFLKNYKKKQLEKLSSDIREFIIDSVSKTGGHLSSNLGIVDLTIALHKVFDFTKDKIIFDVSHQCYTHKILTGRAKDFSTLRQYKGLSGFQKLNESSYDHYEAGHSSTSISAAVGMALARDMDGKKHDVIAVIGDGSIGNGLPYEGINHLGNLNTKVIIILNDNEMSISKNIGAIHNSLDKIRTNYNYKDIKDKVSETIKKIPLIGTRLNFIISNIKKSLKKLYLKEGFLFEEMGLNYYGPINGHDYDEMQLYLNMAKKEKESVILHVITEKGKGYLPAENDKVGIWHGVGPFNKETGIFISKDNVNISWSEVISNHLIELSKKNEDIIALTPAMTNGSKLTKFSEIYPDRFIDVGIAEEHGVVLANALSIEKKKPFISIYSTFLQRAYDEVIHDVARMNSNVVIGIDRSGIVGEDGDTHQGIYDLSFLIPIPNMVIMAPMNSKEAGNMLYTAFNTNSPVAIRYSREKIEYEEQDYEIVPIGTWNKICDGEDATIITYGDFVENAIEVQKILQKDGINIEVVNARFIKPVDSNYIDKLIKKKNPIFIYEESSKIGSLGNYITPILLERGFSSKIYNYAIEDKFIEHGAKNIILQQLELDINSIYKKIRNHFLK